MLNSIYIYIRSNEAVNCKTDIKSYLRLNGFNVPDKKIYFEEKVVKKNFFEKFLVLNNLINIMHQGDILVIYSFDCLGDDLNEFNSKFKLIVSREIRLICLEYSLEILEKKDFEFFFLIYRDFRNFYKNYTSSVQLTSFYNKKEDVFIKFEKGSSFLSLSREYSMSEKIVQEVIQYHRSKLRMKKIK